MKLPFGQLVASSAMSRPSRSRPVVVALVAVPVVLAVVVALLVSRSDSGGGQDDAPEVVDLAAVDTLTVSSLAEMTTAAECVLRGEVVHTERGRALSAELVSRLVQLRVDEALAGDCPPGTVVLEEEGWLADGTPVSVDGWPGSEEGDVGVWFLVAGRSDELPYAATVVTAGAPRWRNGRSVAPGSVPAWLGDSLAGGPDGLAQRVREVG